MEAGFLKLSRKFFASDMWKAHREFSDSEAYLDIMQSASYDKPEKELKAVIKGREISYSCGQFPASLSFLQKRWNWNSTKRVRCFLDKLVKYGIIIVDNSQGINVITVCDLIEEKTLPKVNGAQSGHDEGHNVGHNVDTDNYMNTNDLQEVGTQTRAQSGHDEGHNVDTNNKNKELKNKEKTFTNVNVKKKAAKAAMSETSDSASSPQIDFQRIFEYFNGKMVGKVIKPISRLTDRRKAMIRARCSEYGIQSVFDVIDKAAKSLFLNGNNNRGWTADFDWIFRPNNFPKVLEGNYDKTDKSQQSHNEREKLAMAVDIKAEYEHDGTTYGKFMVFLAERAKYICEHYVLPTRERFEYLIDKIGKREVLDTITALENSYYERRKYTDLYETVIEQNTGTKQ